MADNITTTQGTTNAASSQTGSSLVQKDPYQGALPWLQNIGQSANNVYYNSDPTEQGVQALGGWSTPYSTGNAFLTGSPNGITGQMQAPLNQLGQASNQYQQLFDQQQAQAGSPTGLSQTQNAILDDNAARLGDRLASQYSGAGRYGSAGAGLGLARGIAETNNPLIAQFQQQNVGNSLAALGGGVNAANSQLGGYNQGIQNMQRQMGLQPGLMDLGLAPAKAKWQDLQNYSGVISSMYPVVSQAGSIATNSNAAGTNIGGNTGQTATPTPWTTFAGLGLAGIGAASNVFSDRRLKTDIKKVGKDPWTNLNMYQWRYKGQPKNTPKFVGPMAQDVRKVDPDAVGETPEGILYLKKKVA